MVIAAGVIAGLAAALHVYIFIMESLRWTAPATRSIFGTTWEEAQATQEMAYNQGFYNLFLALTTAIGLVFMSIGTTDIGAALVLAGTGSMAAAAVVLLLSSPDKRSAALKQGTLPLLSVILLAAGLLS